ncbi:MFS transporter [Acidobacteria bacterium Mor1]|nr:MFS transporter [Acidobacteria bacterium Mor1]
MASMSTPETPRSGAARPRPGALPALLSVHFIGTLGFSIVIPFLVYLVTRLGGNAMIYGALGATYSAFQLVGAPVLGRWSDRFGRRRILLLSQAGTLLAWLLFLLALWLPPTELWRVESGRLGAFVLTVPLAVLFLARTLDGLTGGNISVANAYMADITTEENRSRNFGRMSMASSLGFVLGPALAGLLGSTSAGEIVPVSVAAGISLAALALIYFALPESKPLAEPEIPHGTVRRALGAETKGCYDESTATGWRGALARPGIPLMLGLYFLTFLGFSVFYAAFPIYASTLLGWPVASLGVFFSTMSGMMILVQGPVLSRLSKRFNDTTLIVAGSAILGTNFLLLVLADTRAAYAAAVLFALGNGLMWPSFLSLLSRLAGREMQGTVQGVGSSLGSLASILGLLGGGVLVSRLGPEAFLVAAGAIYVVALIGPRLWGLERRECPAK